MASGGRQKKIQKGKDKRRNQRIKMAKDSTADSKVGGVQKTRRFCLVSKYCSKVRIYMYANVDFHCGNRATRLTTPRRRSSLNKLSFATIIYIGNFSTT